MLQDAGQGLTEAQKAVAATPPPEPPPVDLTTRPLGQVLQRKADKAKQVERSKARLAERAQELADAQAARDAELRQLREHEAKLAELEELERSKCTEAAVPRDEEVASAATLGTRGKAFASLGMSSALLSATDNFEAIGVLVAWIKAEQLEVERLAAVVTEAAPSAAAAGGAPDGGHGRPAGSSGGRADGAGT